MTLVNGGAHLDFRTRNGGLTPLHKSSIYSRKEAIVVRFDRENILFILKPKYFRLYLNLVHLLMFMMKKI
jgi:hypothetical protein